LICQVVQLSVRAFRLRSRQAKVENHYSISPFGFAQDDALDLT